MNTPRCVMCRAHDTPRRRGAAWANAGGEAHSCEGSAREPAEVSQERELQGLLAILVRMAQHQTRMGCQSWRIDATRYLQAGWVAVEPIPYQLAQR